MASACDGSPGATDAASRLGSQSSMDRPILRIAKAAGKFIYDACQNTSSNSKWTERAATIEFGTQHRRFVVCPSFTFVATVSAIVTAGFEPLFIDVDPSTWQPDTDALTAALGRFGDDVAAGDILVILESMKMEMPVEAPEAGKVKEIRCRETQPVNEGDILFILE